MLDKIKLLIALEHELLCRGLVMLLSTTEIEVVAIAYNSREAVGLARKHNPSVVLLTLDMADGNAPAAMKQIKRENPQCSVIAFVCNSEGIDGSIHARAAGADGCVFKRSTFKEFLQSVRDAAAGKAVWPAKCADQSAPTTTYRFDAPADLLLTTRQMEVLRHVAGGMTTKEIAAHLHIGYDTAKEHIQNTLRKIGVNNRVQAAVWAVRQGLA